MPTAGCAGRWRQCGSGDLLFCNFGKPEGDFPPHVPSSDAFTRSNAVFGVISGRAQVAELQFDQGEAVAIVSHQGFLPGQGTFETGAAPRAWRVSAFGRQALVRACAGFTFVGLATIGVCGILL
jgi:hypothetical protein